MGKRIVLTSFGSYGDVYPYIGLALGLAERGHRPVIATSAFFRRAVEGAGVEFQPVRPDVALDDADMLRQAADAKRGMEFIVTRLLLPHLRDTYADLRETLRGADLVVTHNLAFAAALLAEHTRVRWTSTVLAPINFFSRYDLPVVSGVEWTKRLERFPGGAGLVLRIGRAQTARWARPIEVLRAELGLPRGRQPFFEGQHSPAQVLGLFSPVLAKPQADWPPRVRLTGPIPYNGPATDRLSPALEAFLAAGDPPLVFTLGTAAVGAAGSFYRESVTAVQRLGVRAVLLVGSHPRNRPEGTVPDGVHVESFAPHAALFPRAAAIVHPAGIGTVHQCLRAGRPSLSVPFANDQPDNAYRLERLGVSRTLRPSRYRADRVTRELATLLSEPGYLARAETLAGVVRREDGVAAACAAIEERFE